MQLQSDPDALAPERLLVFEVTGSVQNFANAVGQIPGLEFAGEEILEADDLDKNPEFYLLVPQLEALNQIVSLWEKWKDTGEVPRGYTPWRDLFRQLRAVRPWGPKDRVSLLNRDYFRSRTEGVPDDEPVRIEVELVFKTSDDEARALQDAVVDQIVRLGGNVLDRSRRSEFAYHALLVDVPAAEIRRIAELDTASLAGAFPIATIVPQSVGTYDHADDSAANDVVRSAPANADPIAAVFDAVPIQAHALLNAHLIVDDPDDLEAKAVGERVHGTAMASLVVHGDLNEDQTPISRKIYFRPVMYAPPIINSDMKPDEIFDPDKLIIDVVVEAVLRMRANGGAHVIVVNLSLGDRTRPFSGKLSTWGRALDYLAYTYGILFLVSAGNDPDDIVIGDLANEAAFNALNIQERAKAIFKGLDAHKIGLDAHKADRRIIAPADSVNALTIGAWHRDAAKTFPWTAPFPPYGSDDMPNVSSRLGPGLRRATKPEVLFAGGREPVRIKSGTAPPILYPHPNPSQYWGLKVAAPPRDGMPDGVHFTMGTSAATALATHTAHRIFDALEAAYPQLISPLPFKERAVLLKALLVHAASWRGSDTFIRSVIDPNETLHHEHWRREVCRYLGYGFVDPEDAVACADDRATMWATGELPPEGAYQFNIPIPAELSANTNPRDVRATLAWLTPIRPGRLAYRAVKLIIASLQDDAKNAAGVKTDSGQPTNSQSESGTVVHRHWRGGLIGTGDNGATLPLQIQREKDQGIPIDEPIPFGLAVTIEMPGASHIYNQILNKIDLKPQIHIRANP